MNDAELATFLNLNAADAAKIIPQISPERRALFEHMAELEVELKLWTEGLGPKPSGVLIDLTRTAGRRRFFKGDRE